MAGREIMLEARDLACWFDLSPSLLARALGEPRRMLRAVNGVSFTIRKGETYAVVGESGCGKSTLAKLVVGLERPTRGTLRWRPGSGGQDGARPRLQMIFQDPYASLNPRWRVEAIIGEPMHELGLARGADAANRVARLLGLVGLARADGARFPHEFSGGQRQRICIARAIATEAEFLVCDEPTSALDVSVQAQILNLMRDLQLELSLTYLFISHNLAVVRHMSDRIAVMYLGRFVEEAPSEELFASPRHPYTKLLLGSIPDLDHPKRDRLPLSGEVPNPMAPPPGCAFHPRCPIAAPVCRETAPEITPAGASRVACHLADMGASS